MKYEALRRVKRMREVDKSRKTKDVSGSKEVVLGLGCSTTIVKGTCVGCGCVLTVVNRSMDSHLCKNCFMVEMAEIEAEDLRYDSMTDEERLADFLG